MSKEHLPRAKKTALHLLTIRPRSEKEIRSKLREKNFSKDTVEQTIKYLCRLKYLDDRQFARNWINMRMAKSFGVGRISSELIKKGISREVIDQELKSNTQNYSEEKTAVELAKRRTSRYTYVEPDKLKRRIFDYLARRGFGLDAIKEAVKKI